MANLSTRHLVCVLCLMLLSAAAPARESEESCRQSLVQPEDINLDQPEDQLAHSAELEIPPDARIGDIRVITRPMFDTDDPDENYAIYQLINWINRPTWLSALRSQLVFAEGDRYDPSEVAESERILRNLAYLSGAWVGPVRVCGNEVDIDVLARDSWTSSLTLGFSRSGGENTTELGISDPNFLGSGKSFSISRTNDADRTTTRFNYTDPNIWGSRWRGNLRLDERSDGSGRRIAIERPFFSEQAEWAFGVEASEDEREEPLFFGGDEVSEFERDRTQLGIYYGSRLATDNDASTEARLLAGYRFDEQRFAPVEGVPAPDPFPEDRTRSYPWVGFQWRENRFHETANLTQLQRVEDVRNGIDFRTEFGYSSEALGGTEDRIVMENRFSDALLATPLAFAEYRMTQSGDYLVAENRVENFTGTFSTQMFYGGVRRWWSWHARLSFTAAEKLTPDQQLSIGGSSGLRGYERRFQEGNRRFLGTLERRFFPDWHPFSLFRVGGVAFADAGRAWFNDDRPAGPEEGVLKDVGFGLRLSSSRFRVDRILHLDFAFPLDGGGETSEFQILVRGRTKF